MKNDTLIIGAVLLGAYLLTTSKARAATPAYRVQPQPAGTAPVKGQGSFINSVGLGSIFSGLKSAGLFNGSTSAWTTGTLTDPRAGQIGDNPYDGGTNFGAVDLITGLGGALTLGGKYAAGSTASTVNMLQSSDDMGLTLGGSFGGASPRYSWDGLTPNPAIEQPVLSLGWGL